jgi:hypothetical protein
MARDVYVPTDEDLDLLTDDLRAGVEAGELTLQHPDTWYSPLRPVVKRDGKMVKGSGKIKGSKDAAVASRETGYKRTKGYQETLEALLPAERADSPSAVSSLRELVEAFWQAVKGSPQKVSCPECGVTSVYAFKQDPHAIMKMIERLTGRAKETQDINIHSESIVALLNERTNMRELQVITIDPEEERRRRELLTENT